MAVIAPFRGYTYNYHVRRDFERLVAPPYDVISKEQQASFYEADPHNVIRLILAKVKTGDSDWDNRYTRAADSFRRWVSSGILLRSNAPCIYLTSLEYDTEGGQTQTRWGIISLVGIEEKDSGVVLPHERTFSAHKDDRLKLMRACNAQLSQIFGLFQDRDNRLLNDCREEANFPPHVSFALADGTRHRMWCLENPRLLRNAAEFMADSRILIADGHHRYETALNFRNMMRARYGRKPAHRAYEFVMMYLTNMNDEGLTILPSHRMVTRVPGFHLKSFLETLERWFTIIRIPVPEQDVPDEWYAALKKNLSQEWETTRIAFFRHEARKCYVLTLKPGISDDMGADLPPSLRTLDVIVLSRLVLQNGLGFDRSELDNEEIFHYQSDMKTAVSQARSGEYQMTFLLNSTKIEQVQDVAGNGLVMPRKSTYFYPKVLSGLVFNEIDPHEIIQVPSY